MSALTAAIRELPGDPGVPVGGAAWPLVHPVFVALSVRAYDRRGR